MKARVPSVAFVAFILLGTRCVWGVQDPRDPDPGAEKIARRVGCFKCHGIDKAIVGPAFRDISARYTKDFAKYDLKTVSAKKNADLPEEGRSLVVVARVGDNLRIRVFDAEGRQITDKADEQLPLGRDLSELKERLPSLLRDEPLAPEQKRSVIANAISAAGLTRDRAYDSLIKTVTSGGKGNWTQVSHGVPMPPYSERLSDEEVQRLVRWVLGR